VLCGAAHADQWTKSYAISGHAQLRFTTNDGTIEVISADAKKIDARVETTGWRIGSSDIQISEHQTGRLRRRLRSTCRDTLLSLAAIIARFAFTSKCRARPISISTLATETLRLATSKGTCASTRATAPCAWTAYTERCGFTQATDASKDRG